MTTRRLRKFSAELAQTPVAARFAKDIQTESSPYPAVQVTLGVCAAGVDVVVRETGRHQYRVLVRGKHARGRRWLYDVLSVLARPAVEAELGEYLVLQEDVDDAKLLQTVTGWIHHLENARRDEEFADFTSGASVSMYWSSSVLNVGDWCGPQLIHAMTGRTPVQVDRPGVSPRALYSVGSILGWITRNNVDIWGSGLMKPLTATEIAVRKKLTGVKVHAVRGKLTQEHVQRDLGWEVPDVYGDPALLLPRYFPGSGKSQGRPVAVPHNVHRELFLKHVPEVKDGSVGLVDVRADLGTVIEQVSTASAVVSTSLHGVIFAQAYGVPWTWLNVGDKPLWGDGFKFADFFSTLGGSDPAQCDVGAADLDGLSLESVAASAALPDLKIDLDALESAMPVPAASVPTPPRP